MVLKFIFNQPSRLAEQFLVGFDLPDNENMLKAHWLLVAMAPKLKIFFRCLILQAFPVCCL